MRFDHKCENHAMSHDLNEEDESFEGSKTSNDKVYSMKRKKVRSIILTQKPSIKSKLDELDNKKLKKRHSVQSKIPLKLQKLINTPEELKERSGDSNSDDDSLSEGSDDLGEIIERN